MEVDLDSVSRPLACGRERADDSQWKLLSKGQHFSLGLEEIWNLMEGEEGEHRKPYI